MMVLLFLLGTVAALMLAKVIHNTGKLKAFLGKRTAKAQLVPRAISVLVVVAQASELVRVIEHTSIVTIAAALFLLATLLATKSGTEGELH